MKSQHTIAIGGCAIFAMIGLTLIAFQISVHGKHIPAIPDGADFGRLHISMVPRPNQCINFTVIEGYEDTANFAIQVKDKFGNIHTIHDKQPDHSFQFDLAAIHPNLAKTTQYNVRVWSKMAGEWSDWKRLNYSRKERHGKR